MLKVYKVECSGDYNTTGFVDAKNIDDAIYLFLDCLIDLIPYASYPEEVAEKVANAIRNSGKVKEVKKKENENEYIVNYGLLWIILSITESDQSESREYIDGHFVDISYMFDDD